MPEDVRFISTYQYLPLCLQRCAELVQACDAVDRVWFRPMFNEFLKSAVYNQFRHDLATLDTYDPAYEAIFSETYDLKYPWPPRNLPECILDNYRPTPEQWAKRRIFLHMLVSQVLSLPYTFKNMGEFVKLVENELHFCDPANRPWIRVMFTPSYPPYPSKNQNILWVIMDYQALIPMLKQQIDEPALVALFDNTADAVVILCRRMCPCNIYVKTAEFRNDTNIVTAGPLYALANGQIGLPIEINFGIELELTCVTVTNLPAGLEFDPDKSQIVGAATADPNAYNIQINAYDPVHTDPTVKTVQLVVYQTALDITLPPQDPPLKADMLPIAYAREAYEAQVNIVNDPTLPYTARADLPPQVFELTFSKAVVQEGPWDWRITTLGLEIYEGEAQHDPYPVTIIASDAATGEVQKTFDLYVLEERLRITERRLRPAYVGSPYRHDVEYSKTQFYELTDFGAEGGAPAVFIISLWNHIPSIYIAHDAPVPREATGRYPLTLTLKTGIETATTDLTLYVLDNKLEITTTQLKPAYVGDWAYIQRISINQSEVVRDALNVTSTALPNPFTIVKMGVELPWIVSSGAVPVGSAGVHPITLTASNGVEDNSVQNLDLYVLESRLEITTTQLKPAYVRVPYTEEILTQQSRHIPQGSLNITGEGLPNPFRIIVEEGRHYLDGAGIREESVGTHRITLTASNGIEERVEKPLTLYVLDAKLEITTTRLPPAYVGDRAYRQRISINQSEVVRNALTVTSTALPNPFTIVKMGVGLPWIVSSGAVPVGSAGVHPITLTASNGIEDGSVQNLDLYVLERKLEITTTQLKPAYTRGVYGETIEIQRTQYIPWESLNVTGEGLPDQFEVRKMTEYRPQPTQIVQLRCLNVPVGSAGAHRITLTASNGIEERVEKPLTLYVLDAKLEIRKTEFKVAYAGKQYQDGVQVVCDIQRIAAQIVRLTVTAGLLPAQFVLERVDPLHTDWNLHCDQPIHAEDARRYQITLTASNGIERNDVKPLTLYVLERKLEIITDRLPIAYVGANYSEEIRAVQSQYIPNPIEMTARAPREDFPEGFTWNDHTHRLMCDPVLEAAARVNPYQIRFIANNRIEAEADQRIPLYVLKRLQIESKDVFRAYIVETEPFEERIAPVGTLWEQSDVQVTIPQNLREILEYDAAAHVLKCIGDISEAARREPYEITARAHNNVEDDVVKTIRMYALHRRLDLTPSEYIEEGDLRYLNPPAYIHDKKTYQWSYRLRYSGFYNRNEVHITETQIPGFVWEDGGSGETYVDRVLRSVGEVQQTGSYNITISAKTPDGETLNEKFTLQILSTEIGATHTKLKTAKIGATEYSDYIQFVSDDTIPINVKTEEPPSGFAFEYDQNTKKLTVKWILETPIGGPYRTYIFYIAVSNRYDKFERSYRLVVR